MANLPNQIDEFLNELLPYPCGPRILELRKELEDHLLEGMEEHLEQGLSKQEAFQAAVVTLGPIRGLKRHIRRIHRHGRRKRPIQLIAGLSLLILYPLALFLFFPNVNFSLVMLLPLLVGVGMLFGAGFGTHMDIVLSKYEPLEDNSDFTALFGNGMKYKE
ncbi:permease prefix domain 1-containing protein [Gorillibacterium timonense]|uniref:permease prefix domain 1-containing protein n=1 Tax=Gorillibacterium timonense TaxID=1689269 RepID=UPI00071DC493|nr:permease prefix domain 1-containing protein [Gorillibacterium timonense]